MELQLFESACRGFKRLGTEEFRADVANHVRDGSLYVVVEENRVEGFGVLKDFPSLSATYIAGIAKSMSAPAGVIEAIVTSHVTEVGSSVVTVRTQNDRVVEIMKDLCRVVVPMHREAGEDELLLLRRMGLDRASNGQEVNTDMVAYRHYGGEPMIGSGERRRSGNFLVRQVTDRLNYYQGDALLLIGYL